HVPHYKDCVAGPGIAMKTAFWISSVFVIYTYLGYVLWLWLHARIRPRLVRTGMYAGTASIVMVVRDEAGRVGAKLQNLLSLEKPGKEVEVIVISDGSSDATVEILQQFEARGLIKAMVHAEPRGKAACISDALATAKGEIVFFADVRQQIEPPALRLLAENFVDPEVGCVSGELMLGDPKSGEASRGMGLYWRIEKLVRSEEHTSELQSQSNLVCRLLLEKKKTTSSLSSVGVTCGLVSQRWVSAV